MSSAGGVNGPSSSSGASSPTTDRMSTISPDDFLKMLITQLQHQDPTNPTDSNQILQQISMIDNISATTNLSSTLNAVAADQGFQAASAMIGMQVEGIDAKGDPVSGVVDSATFSNGIASLNVGSQTMQLAGISSISKADTSADSSADTPAPTTGG